jgi:mono/diheme cytochrome c family protein
MRHLPACTFALALLAVSALASAQESAASAERGKAAFMKNMCYSCHGTAGQGGERTAGPRLAPHTLPLVVFRIQLRQPRGVMPRYPEQFVNDQEVADMQAYLSSIPAGPAAKDIPLLSGF